MQTEATTAGEQREELRRSVEKLYELADSIEDLHEATGGVIDWRSETLQKFLDEATTDTLESLLQFIAEMEACMAAATTERQRVAAYHGRCESKMEWAEKIVLDVMRKLGVRKVDVGTWNVSVRKGAASVKQREGAEIDLGLFPPDLVRDIPARQEPDKKAIAAALKEHEKKVAEAVERGDSPEEIAAINAVEPARSFYIAFGEEYVVIK